MSTLGDLQKFIDLACSGAGITMLTLLGSDEVVHDELAQFGQAVLDEYRPGENVTVYQLAGDPSWYLAEVDDPSLHAAWASDSEPTQEQAMVATGLALIQLTAFRHDTAGGHRAGRRRRDQGGGSRLLQLPRTSLPGHPA